jgi:trigger factor
MSELPGITVSRTKDEPGAVSLRVEIPAERVNAAESKATKRYAQRARLPGFRKGKAPVQVIRKQFRDAIREDVLRELVADSWKIAVDQEGLKPIADPRMRDLKWDEGAPVSFELMVEVKPELDLQRLGGFRLTRKLPAVSDEMVDEQLDEMRRQRAPWVPVEDRTPAPGEMVSLTLTTVEDGAAGEARPYQLVLGSGQAIPDLEELVMTVRPGGTAEGTVRYPDDFPDESKRGNVRTVRVALQDVKRPAIPDLTDDFARELGDFESVEALRAAVRTDLEDAARREADAEVRRELMGELISANAVVAPPPLVQRALSAFAQAYGVPDEQLEQFAGEFGPLAERQVQRDLIIDHVAEREQLAATDDDVDARVAEIAKRRNMQPGEMYASLQKANRLREIERSLTEERVFAYLLSQSTIDDA